MSIAQVWNYYNLCVDILQKRCFLSILLITIATYFKKKVFSYFFSPCIFPQVNNLAFLCNGGKFCSKPLPSWDWQKLEVGGRKKQKQTKETQKTKIKNNKIKNPKKAKQKNKKQKTKNKKKRRKTKQNKQNRNKQTNKQTKTMLSFFPQISLLST